MNIVGNRTLKSALEDKARRFPAKTFVLFEDRTGHVERYTYDAFDRRVNQVAHALGKLGLARGDKFNLHLRNSPEFLFCWFAAAKTGTVMVPTHPDSTPDEMAYILGHSEAKVSFVQGSSAAAVLACRGRCPGLQEVVATREGPVEGARALAEVVERQPADPPEASLGPLDEVAMMYTSGTTSKPKGVLITHANYLHGGEMMAKAMRVAPDDRHLIVLPFFHAGAHIHAFVPTLLAGASAAVMEGFSASRFWDQAIAYGATLAALFAAPVRMLLNQPDRPHHRQHRLRLVTYAQNVTPEEFEAWHARFGVRLMQLWGMTESMSLPLINPLDLPSKPLSMGMPALGAELRVVDDAGQEVPPRTVGELVLRGVPGVSLMKGYFKNPEATAEAIRGEWLYTGDLAWMDEEGYFHFVDRKKDIIKRAGENVAAGEVEAVLRQHGAVADAAVIGVPDPVRDEAIKALVILREGGRATAEELIEWCGARLSKFKVPEIVEFRETFPRTSVGKIQKHLLRGSKP
ncbi:MAG: AMP-binding protein [Candidatus Rokubacteria bacterium]|nr:AMP-binding protein [Candidatus Rokubacteria bacterium]